MVYLACFFGKILFWEPFENRSLYKFSHSHWFMIHKDEKWSNERLMKPKVDVLNSQVLSICIQELICSWPLPTHPPFAFQFYLFFICLTFCLFYVSRLRTYCYLRWGNRYLWPRRGNGMRHTVLFRRLVQRWLRWRLVTVLNKSP